MDMFEDAGFRSVSADMLNLVKGNGTVALGPWLTPSQMWCTSREQPIRDWRSALDLEAEEIVDLTMSSTSVASEGSRGPIAWTKCTAP